VNLLDPRIEEYLERLTPPSPAVVAEMEALAARRHFPIVGPLVGRLLYIMTRTLGARNVLECGSGFGYSACWFAEALPPGGRVVLTESSAENCAQARDFLARAGHREKAAIHQANALDIIERVNGMFDIIFCDIDKTDYPRVYPFIKKRLRVGGLFMCDNMLWLGKVATGDADPDTRGVRDLTRLLYADTDLMTAIVPLRDGVSLSYRLA
jgi:predicted O-methyltransferase YrrM